ncbi:NADH-dependent butanol dehydrogenase a [Bacillus subtilis]|uniref:NADH-dependent butanol dehydrogenase a n=1 Tax=Bacillus subtilis TaxID=1423 RepID=A0A0D1KGL4_BACIU|nr:NADH-dependent butanol dehydrogenase a [Bacillus subtilis]
MQNFTYWNPTKLIFGRGEVERLPEELKPYGKKRIACVRRRQH